MKQASTVLSGWMRYLDDKRIQACLLRTLNDTASNDCADGIEIAIARSALPKLPELMFGFCQSEQLLLAQCVRIEEETWRYVLSWSGEHGSTQFLCIELLGDYYHCSRRLLTSQQLQASCVTTSAPEPEQRLQRVVPSIEFMHRLLRCVDGQTCSPEEVRRLRGLWQQDAAGTANLLSRLWPHEGSGLIASAACDRWENLVEGLPRLQRALRPRRLAALRARRLWLTRQMHRMRRPTGLLVACLGPDGSGKRALIGRLCNAPLPGFNHIYTMRMRPRLIRQAPVNPTVKPWLEKPRSAVVLPAKLAVFFVDYWLGYLMRIWPRLTRAGLVVSDRYYDDVLVDPRRYRMRRRYGLARALVPWIPRPDLWLILDVPAKVLQERQQEVTEEESVRLRSEYRRVLRGKDNVLVLDASRTEQQVLLEAQRAIIKRLSQRTGERLGLPKDAVRNPLSTRILLFYCRHRVPVIARLVRMIFNSDIECRLPADIHLPHPYGLVVHPAAVIGNRVTLMQQVTIGAVSTNPSVAPVIAEGVYVGAGARVLGDVRVGERAVIGANAVVTKDVPPGATVVGANRVVTSPSGVSTADRGRVSELNVAQLRKS